MKIGTFCVLAYLVDKMCKHHFTACTTEKEIINGLWLAKGVNIFKAAWFVNCLRVTVMKSDIVSGLMTQGQIVPSGK